MLENVPTKALRVGQTMAMDRQGLSHVRVAHSAMNPRVFRFSQLFALRHFAERHTTEKWLHLWLGQLREGRVAGRSTGLSLCEEEPQKIVDQLFLGLRRLEIWFRDASLARRGR